jgi:hypothetical protein
MHFVIAELNDDWFPALIRPVDLYNHACAVVVG